jgi:hypothetical protein
VQASLCSFIACVHRETVRFERVSKLASSKECKNQFLVGRLPQCSDVPSEELQKAQLSMKKLSDDGMSTYHSESLAGSRSSGLSQESASLDSRSEMLDGLAVMRAIGGNRSKLDSQTRLMREAQTHQSPHKHKRD